MFAPGLLATPYFPSSMPTPYMLLPILSLSLSERSYVGAEVEGEREY